MDIRQIKAKIEVKFTKVEWELFNLT